MRVVCDTNVVISAYLSPAGNSAKIIGAWEQQRFDLVVSEQLVGEYERALSYKRVAERHGLSREDIAAQMQGFRTLSVLAKLGAIPSVVAADPADDVVLATAVAGSASYIVSGDEHLQRVGEYRGIEILSPRAFLTLLATAP